MTGGIAPFALSNNDKETKRGDSCTALTARQKMKAWAAFQRQITP